MGLNTPTGARCFPTAQEEVVYATSSVVLIHLQVRGASRQQNSAIASVMVAVLIHLQVRGASRPLERNLK